ncbi:hypothetical protein GCM10023221_19160 [Luteimicrobium xylanilyticum]
MKRAGSENTPAPTIEPTTMAVRAPSPTVTVWLPDDEAPSIRPPCAGRPPVPQSGPEGDRGHDGEGQDVRSAPIRRTTSNVASSVD